MNIPDAYSVLGLNKDDKPCILTPLSHFSYPYKVEFGSGENPVNPLDEWIHTDPRIKTSSDNNHIEVMCYAQRTPFETNSVKEIMCMGTWEHFTFYECFLALNEWARILDRRGTALFNFPPIDHAFGLYKKGKVSYRWMSMAVFGHQRFVGDEHKSGWTIDYIDKWLKEYYPQYYVIDDIFWGDSRRNDSEPYRFKPSCETFGNYTDPYDYPGAHVWVKLRRK